MQLLTTNSATCQGTSGNARRTASRPDLPHRQFAHDHVRAQMLVHGDQPPSTRQQRRGQRQHPPGVPDLVPDNGAMRHTRSVTPKHTSRCQLRANLLQPWELHASLLPWPPLAQSAGCAQQLRANQLRRPALTMHATVNFESPVKDTVRRCSTSTCDFTFTRAVSKKCLPNVASRANACLQDVAEQAAHLTDSFPPFTPSVRLRRGCVALRRPRSRPLLGDNPDASDSTVSRCLALRWPFACATCCCCGTAGAPGTTPARGVGHSRPVASAFSRAEGAGCIEHIASAISRDTLAAHKWKLSCPAGGGAAAKPAAHGADDSGACCDIFPVHICHVLLCVQASFHEWEFRIRLRIAGKTGCQYIAAMSKVCDGLRRDALVAAQEVGFDNLCVIVDGRQRGFDTLTHHMRGVVFPLTEHESKELFRQYYYPGGPDKVERV